MRQKIEALSPQDNNRIEAQRKWVREHYPPESEFKYETLSGKLALIDTILQHKWIERSETVKLQSLGVCLGDALVQQEPALRWVIVEDEFGRDPALNYEWTSIIIAPLTMISKRLEREEEVDIYELFGQVLKHLREIKSEAD